MFFEGLEANAEKQQTTKFSFPMLVGSKVRKNNSYFSHIQLFANVVSESAALETQEIFFEATAKIEDIHFTAKSLENTSWVALTNYDVPTITKLLTKTLHSLRVSLFAQLAKNLGESKLIDKIHEGLFYDAVDACYPNIDLKCEVKALVHLEKLLTENDYQLREIERPSTGCGGELFKAVNQTVCLAQELLLKQLEQSISNERVSEIRKSLYTTRFTY